MGEVCVRCGSGVLKIQLQICKVLFVLKVFKLKKLMPFLDDTSFYINLNYGGLAQAAQALANDRDLGFGICLFVPLILNDLGFSVLNKPFIVQFRIYRL